MSRTAAKGSGGVSGRGGWSLQRLGAGVWQCHDGTKEVVTGSGEREDEGWRKKVEAAWGRVWAEFPPSLQAPVCSARYISLEDTGRLKGSLKHLQSSGSGDTQAHIYLGR